MKRNSICLFIVLLFLFSSNYKGFSQQVVLTSNGEKAVLNYLSSLGGTISGALTTSAGINNTGTITNTGSLINNGTLTNNGNATITGTLTVGGSSLSFASYTSAGTTTISSGNHIVSGAGITLDLNTSTPIAGTFCIIYNPSNSYTLSQNGTSSTIAANNTTVCIYAGSGWVAYSNGVAVSFS